MGSPALQEAAAQSLCIQGSQSRQDLALQARAEHCTPRTALQGAEDAPSTLLTSFPAWVSMVPPLHSPIPGYPSPSFWGLGSPRLKFSPHATPPPCQPCSVKIFY